MLYESLLRPALFRVGHGDAERAHELTLGALARVASKPYAVRALAALSHAAPATPRTVFGVDFPGVVGLAAGMDKDGRALQAWPALGFSFVEVGTVTAHAQPGNDKPRLFRLRDSEAVINRMGFNNSGAAALAIRLAAAGPLPVPLGISLGKSKATPIEDAVEDYLTSLRLLRGHGDYIAVNVSSPNTPGLRGLQDAGQLSALLAALRAEAGGTPLLVKIAPDLTDAAIVELLGVCDAHGVAGIIATNTTLSRDGLADPDQPRAAEAGGLSGRPLRERAREVVALVARETGGKLPIVGVGGISGGDDAARMLDAGASLVQLYSALIFRGPSVLREINQQMRRYATDAAHAPAPARPR